MTTHEPDEPDEPQQRALAPTVRDAAALLDKDRNSRGPAGT